MEIRKYVISVAAGTAVVLAIVVPSHAATCSNTITNESIKIQNSLIKSFLKCNDAYRKDQTNKKGTGTPPFGVAGTACEKELTKKVFGPTGVLLKEIAKLQSKVGASATCKDADLLALGQLDNTNFPNRMSEGVGMTAFNLAYQEQADSTQDWGKMLQDMIDSGKCPSCAKLRTPPCVATTCNFLAAGQSQASVGLLSAGPSTSEIPVPLIGISTLAICDASQILTGLAGADNALFVVGAPGKQVQPSTVLAQRACVTQVSANGIIACSGSNNALAYTTCQDHNTGGVKNAAGATTSGDCSGDACQQSSADKDDATITNGGACFKGTKSAASEGDAFIFVTNQIRLSDAPGTDGLFCTPDDTYSVPETGAEATPFTTRTADATVKNADNTADSIDTSGFGSPGIKFPSCAKIRQGDMTGGAKLVGAFTALNTLTSAKLDSVTYFFLTCN